MGDIAAKEIELLTTRPEDRIGNSIYGILPSDLAIQYMVALQQSLVTQATQVFEDELTIHDIPGHYEVRGGNPYSPTRSCRSDR
ncbi:MAG: hypothetical protein AB4042_02160 [Leptolyngbyaceae cyanobacterium]